MNTLLIRVTVLFVGMIATGLIIGCDESTEPDGLTEPVVQVTVTAVDPAGGLLVGGTTVTISGTNFVDVTGVTIGGEPLVNRAVRSNTRITGVTPAAMVSGPRDVVVTSRVHGSGTCTDCFTYYPAVTVTAVTPATGPLTGGTSVTVTGTNFLAVSRVTLGTVDLADLVVLSDTQLTGTTAAATDPGQRDVVVISSSYGTGSCDGCFAYLVEFVSVSAGADHTCGLTSVGVAYCWGSKDAMGIGATQVPYCGEFGYCSTVPVAPVVGGITFTHLDAGEHTCAIATGGTVYCWGTNRAALFSGVPVAVRTGVIFTALSSGIWDTCGITGTRTVDCWGLLRGAVSGGPFTEISVLGEHACALDTGGSAYCWGDNSFGELGHGSTESSSTPVPVAGHLTFTTLSAGPAHTCAIATTGAAYCWGINYAGELGIGTTIGPETCSLDIGNIGCSFAPVAVTGGLTFSAVSAGSGFTCGITTGGSAYCWGGNSYGQLGDGSTNSRSVPVAVAGGHTFAAVSAGTYHVCAITTSGVTYCWGENRLGQLGTGTQTNSSVPLKVYWQP